jgi:hypothetical protein
MADILYTPYSTASRRSESARQAQPRGESLAARTQPLRIDGEAAAAAAAAAERCLGGRVCRGRAAGDLLHRPLGRLARATSTLWPAASRELRRVLYSATGQLPAIGGEELLSSPTDVTDTALVLGRLDELEPSLRAAVGGTSGLGSGSEEAHVVWTTSSETRTAAAASST